MNSDKDILATLPPPAALDAVAIINLRAVALDKALAISPPNDAIDLAKKIFTYITEGK